MAKTRKAGSRPSARLDTAGNARERQLKSESGPYNPIQVQGFSPTANQLKYLFALRDAAVDGRPTSDAEMNRLTKISRMTMWEWKKEPAFVDWLRAAMQTEHDHDFELAMARHLRLAIKGSVRSFEAVARVRSLGMKGGGFEAAGDAVDQSVRNYTVNLLVPRPPALPIE